MPCIMYKVNLTIFDSFTYMLGFIGKTDSGISLFIFMYLKMLY